ncbi:glycosyltransferase [Nocardiopsis coralliicola]
MKIVYVIHDLYGIGGTIRTVLNQAGAMAARGHDVEIASVFRDADEPALPVPPGVAVTPLVDECRTSPDPRAQQPSRLYPAEEKHYSRHSARSDALIAGLLAARRPDVVVGTRAGINVLLARLSPAGPLVVGQEHLTLGMYDAPLLAVMARAYRGLDALCPVTEADAAAYRARMRLPGVRIAAVPNCVPEPGLIADAEARSAPPELISAGRITGMKGYDLLIDAFARICGDYPDWTLRIYGRGRGMADRKRQIAALGLHDRAFMMGAHPRIEEAWALGALAAVPSRDEPFGMSIVEAMRCGLPVVAADCPHGPREIIADGEDGLLVAPEDSAALARGLDRLMGDSALRARMARAALRASARYAPDTVAQRHEELFGALLAARGRGRRTPPPSPRVIAPRGAATGGCTAAAGPDGSVELLFPAPPDTVVLRSAGGTGAEQRLRTDPRGAVLVDAADLPEGITRWSVLRSDGGEEREVHADLIDLRRAPSDPRTAKRLRTVLPERTGHGALTLTGHLLPAYAEAERVAVLAEETVVAGRVLGASAPDPDAVLLLRARGHSDVSAEVPCPVDAAGRFRAAIPTALPCERAAPILAAGRGNRNGAQLWNLRLRAKGRNHPIGRTLLGAARWKHIVSYPAVPHRVAAVLGGDAPPGILLHPFYSADGLLSLATEPLDAAPEDAGALAAAASDAVLRWGGPHLLEIEGLVRSRAAEAAELALTAVNADGATVGLDLHTERTERGVRYTAAVDLGPGALHFGSWRLILAAEGPEGTRTVDLASPGPKLARRWWRGVRPVAGRILPAQRDGDVLIEHTPLQLAKAVLAKVR